MLFLKESEGVDKDGDQEHRRHWKVLQRQNHHRVRHWGLGGGAHRPEDPASKRAEGGHRRDGPGSEETLSLFRDEGPPLMPVYKSASDLWDGWGEPPLHVFTFTVTYPGQCLQDTRLLQIQ